MDPVLRRVSFSDGLYFFLSDTVGFIKKIPIELITSFKATLEELKEADCILHVVDITSSNQEGQMSAVEATLAEIGVTDIPIIRIYNKIDRLPDKTQLLAKNIPSDGHSLYVSAKTGEGMQNLKDRLRATLFKHLKLFYLRIPKSDRELIGSFSSWTMVLKRREDGDFFELKLMADPQSILNYSSFIQTGEKNW